MKRDKEIYMHFIIRALPIMIIPVLFMTFAYFRNLQVIRGEVYDKNVSIIENNARLVENTLESTESIVNYLNENVGINKFLNYDTIFNDGTNTVAVNTLQSDLKALVVGNDLIKDIHIYAKKNKMLLTYAGVVIDLSRYYGADFGIENVPYGEWIKQILTGDNQKKKLSYSTLTINDGQAAMLYSSNLPMQATQKDSLGTVNIFLDQNKLIRNFDNIDYQNGYFYIQDSDQNILYEYNGTSGDIYNLDEELNKKRGFFLQTIENENYFVTYYVDENQWVYVAAIPKKLTEGQVNDNIFYLLAMLLFTLLIGILLVHFFSKQLSKPLAKGFRLLKAKSSRMTYNTFNEVVEEMIEQNTQMQEEIDKQLPALKASVFHTLITGGYSMEIELVESLKKIGVKTNAKQYVILIISLNDLEVGNDLKRISIQKIYLRELIVYILGTDQVYDLDFEQIGVLFAYDCLDMSQARLQCEEKLKELKEQCYHNQISITFYGDVVKNLQDIPASFRRIKHIIEKIDPAQGDMEWYSKEESETVEGYYYPKELEKRLLTAISWGNIVETKCIMEKIVRRNRYLLDDTMNPNLLPLLRQMQNSLLQIMNNDDVPSEKTKQLCDKISQAITGKIELPQSIFLLEEAFLYQAERRKARWQVDNDYMKEKLRKFTNENYKDPQLTLAMVAKKFELSEVYLSKLFKRFFQQNFSKYIEKLRIDQAKIMVEEGEYRITEIAQQVGYNSPQSFRRAYKRVFGCAPRDH